MSYATTHQIASVIADPGSYYFLSLVSNLSHVVLANTSNVTIDFQGSELILANEQRIGIALYNCTNIVLQNFTVDYQQLPFTQLQVVSVDAANRQIHYSVPAGWRDPSVFSTAQMVSGTLNGFYVFIFRDGQPAPNLTRMQFQTPVAGGTFSIANDGTPATSAATLTQIRPGDTAVLSARDNLEAIFSSNCVACTLRNIRVYSSPGVGVFMSSPQSMVIDHVYAMPKPGTNRLVSTNADGLSFGQPGSNNTMRLSRSIRTQDDGFSPHSLIFGTVLSQTGTATLQVQPEFNDGVQSGSPVVFQSVVDGTMLGSAVVVTQNPTPTQPPNNSGVVTVNFDRALPANLIGAAIYTTDPAQRGASTVLDRDTVQAQVFARGISLWGLVNSTVKGSYIHHSSLSGIDGTHQLDSNDWMSPPLTGLTLANNVIDGTNFTEGGTLTMGGIDILAQQSAQLPMPTSPHQNITLDKNFVADSGYASIWVGNVTDGSVSGNYLWSPNDRGPNPYNPNGVFGAYLLNPLVIETSQNVTTNNNTVDQTSSRMFITDTEYNELAAYSPGSVYRINAYNLGTLTNPSVTLTDSSGNAMPVAIENTATHALDVQIPASAALGGAYFTLTSGSTKYFGTLFLDTKTISQP